MGALYFVSREIRAELLRHVKLSLPTATGYCTYPWTYINSFYDTVFCRTHWGYGWEEIPTESEAPGLWRLAIHLNNRLNYRSPWLDREENIPETFRLDRRVVESLAIQLRGLPELRELLLVRSLPTFIGHFLDSIDCKTQAHNAKKPELVVNESGFFWNTHEFVELMLKRAIKYGRRVETREPVQDEVDYLVSSLVEEEDAKAFLPEDVDEDLLYAHERTSAEVLDHFVGLMKEVYEEKYPGAVVPKVTMVYMSEGIARDICDHPSHR